MTSLARTLLSVTTLALTAAGCSAYIKAPLYNTGYKYHTSTHAARPGPHPRAIGYTYTPAINRKSMQIWDNIAENLVDALEHHFNVRAQPLYLQPQRDASTFVNSYEFAIQKALRKRGYTLVNDSNYSHKLYIRTQPGQWNADEATLANNTALQKIDFNLYLLTHNTYATPITVSEALPAFYTNVTTAPIYMAHITAPYDHHYTYRPITNSQLNQNHTHTAHTPKRSYPAQTKPLKPFAQWTPQSPKHTDTTEHTHDTHPLPLRKPLQDTKPPAARSVPIIIYPSQQIAPPQQTQQPTWSTQE